MVWLMKSPTLNRLSRILKPRVAKSPVLPTIAPIKGVSRSLVNAPTTVAKAAPITTPTAMSMTLPRRMNFLKPSSISALLELEWPTLYCRGKGQVKDRSCGKLDRGCQDFYEARLDRRRPLYLQIRMGITM